jgi:hypothetical protein
LIPDPGLDAELLGVSVRLRVPPHLVDEIGRQLAPLGFGGRAATAAEVLEIAVRQDDRGFRATTSAGTELRDDDPVAIAVAALTAELVTGSPCFCVHAGVVAHAGRAWVVPGTSGHGKTTLTAALVKAGFGYISDEVLAIDRVSHAVYPFRRPLALSHDVWPLLGLDAALRPDPGRERLVAPAVLGSGGEADRVTDIVLTCRDGSTPSVSALPRASAVTALLEHSFNHYRDPDSSFRVAVETARHANVWLARYDDAPGLARLLMDRVRLA